MAVMGDWRNNKDEEIELDGIGGVNIIVKADVHRSGMSIAPMVGIYLHRQASTSHATPLRTRPKRKALQKWPNEQDIK